MSVIAQLRSRVIALEAQVDRLIKRADAQASWLTDLSEAAARGTRKLTPGTKVRHVCSTYKGLEGVIIPRPAGRAEFSSVAPYEPLIWWMSPDGKYRGSYAHNLVIID